MNCLLAGNFVNAQYHTDLRLQVLLALDVTGVDGVAK